MIEEDTSDSITKEIISEATESLDNKLYRSAFCLFAIVSEIVWLLVTQVYMAYLTVLRQNNLAKARFGFW